MNSLSNFYKLHKFLFLFLIIVTIIDPGNNIFKLKEFLFILTFLVGLINFNKYIRNNILIGSIFFSIIFPLIWLLFGYLFNYNFSLEFAIMYLKALAFFIMIIVSLDSRIDFSKLFALATFLLIPLTIGLFVYANNFILLYITSIENTDAFVISKREIGGFIFDPTVFYKTSPLLIFGLAYLCQKNRFYFSILNIILISLCSIAIIISGTRANMLGSFIILFYFAYKHYFSNNKLIKLLFYPITSIIFIFYLIPFLSENVFNKSEASNELKLGIIDDYFSLWSHDFFSIILGQGLGGGFNISERGLSYIAEPTYFEILRMFGLIGTLIFIIFLTIPLILFLRSKSTFLFKKNYYIFFGYMIYIFIEVPSNPLLLSSTGMIVMVVVYSTALKVYYSSNNINKNNYQFTQ